MANPSAQLRVARLTPETREDFFRLHANSPRNGFCHCVGWWVPTWDGWSERKAEQNRALRLKLFAEGVDDGYLAYDGAEPVGWCQVWRRDAFAKLKSQFSVQSDSGAWMIGCFFIAPEHRQQGIAKTMLAFILADLKTRGATIVDAFPKRESHEADELWNGPEPMFTAAGFRIVTNDPKRPLMRLTF